jgi:hypothetical protein
MITHWLTWKDILGMAGGVVILAMRSWLVSKTVVIGEKLFAKLEHRLVTSEHEAVLWLHYRNHAARTNHSPRRPADCSDDGCRDIKR